MGLLKKNLALQGLLAQRMLAAAPRLTLVHMCVLNGLYHVLKIFQISC